jgi:hypothetical protein
MNKRMNSITLHNNAIIQLSLVTQIKLTPLFYLISLMENPNGFAKPKS